MSSSDLEGLPLIQTKLHRPLVPVDLVPRPQLTSWLDERRQRPITLVSAPAGYGKSTVAEILRSIATGDSNKGRERARTLFQSLWWYDQVVFDASKRSQ